MAFSTGLTKAGAFRSQNLHIREAYKPIEHVVTQMAAIPARIKQRAKSLGRGLGEIEHAVSRGVRRGGRLNPVTDRPKQLPGETYAKAKTQRLQRERRAEGKPLYRGEVEKVHRQAEAEVTARRKKLKRSGKPSFWQRHPIATGLAGVGVGKALSSSDKEDKGQPSPYVVYPNQ